MTPSEAIKKIRWELRLSQQELADAIQCAQTSISSYELGLRMPHYNILKRLDSYAKENNLTISFL